MRQRSPDGSRRTQRKRVACRILSPRSEGAWSDAAVQSPASAVAVGFWRCAGGDFRQPERRTGVDGAGGRGIAAGAGGRWGFAPQPPDRAAGWLFGGLRGRGGGAG